LPTYREENNVLLISDLTVLLKNILGNNEAPFIYEKIGNRYENIMIDEFQDTSEYQWSNFKPLIENTLSQNRQNLIVGDVKQSIYRWRNGDWRLLHSGVKNEIGKMYVSETSLDTNWRSKRDVVLFNNSLFNKLPEILKTKLLSDNTNSDEFIEMSNVLISAYEDTIQKIAKKNQEGGYVELNFYDNKNSFNEGIEESIINTIKNLFEKNFKAGDIAFLTRTNAESVKIMEILLAYNAEIEEDKQFNVISAESLLLSNSLTIKILISCLKLISNPTEIIYLYEIISNYYQLTNQKITKEIFEIETFKEAEKFLPLDFINLFEIFSNYSLFELVEKLLSYFELTKNKNEIAFIRTFQETINNYVSDTGKDLNGFLKYWDKKQNNISVQLSEQNEAMQVMTIHKSKGLAFKIVIMPFITWDITPNNDTILWGNTSSTIFNHYAYFPVYYNKDLPKTHFASEFFSEKLYACMDALNMLYVAFTRAQEQIIGFSYLTQTRNGNNIGDHLCRAIIESEEENTDKYLIPLKKYYDENLLRFCIGEQIYFEQKINEQYKNFEIRNYPTHDWYDNVSIVTHSEDLIADTLKNRKLAIKHGIQMHMLFSKIKTYDDVEDVLNELKQNNKINEKDKNEIFDTINKVFENEQVKYWFDKSWILHNEKEILTKYGETKIPDRVISNQNEVIVIDYKFGLEQGEHKRQISRYLTLIKEIETVKKYTGYLLYADTMKIVEITN
jgi:ATP-dependent exoDNAse (exonuclease V) beta subunit